LSEGILEFFKKWFYYFCNPICQLVSNENFPKIFSGISIIIIFLRIGAQFFDFLSFLKADLDIIVYIVLVFSIFGLIYQTQRLDIIIYPPKIGLIDLENWYGVKDISHEKEREIEILFSKEGFLKIILHSITIDYPAVGDLQILRTSFFVNDRGRSRGFVENFQNGQEKIIDQEIEGFGGIICCFRIHDKEKYFPMTTHKIKIKFCYRVLGFIMYKEKSVTINP